MQPQRRRCRRRRAHQRRLAERLVLCDRRRLIQSARFVISSAYKRNKLLLRELVFNRPYRRRGGSSSRRRRRRRYVGRCHNTKKPHDAATAIERSLAGRRDSRNCDAHAAIKSMA